MDIAENRQKNMNADRLWQEFEAAREKDKGARRAELELMLQRKCPEAFGNGACHILALKLMTHLAGKNFKLKRIKVLNDDIPMRQALHVYVARDGIAIDWKGTRSEAEILKQYDDNAHSGGRGVIAVSTTCSELELERADEPGINQWRLRLDKDFRQLAEPVADQWIADHQQILESF